MSGPIDLSRLPKPKVIEELDYETILEQRKQKLLSLVPEDRRQEVEETLALESEPLTIQLQENAYRELVWRKRVNEASVANMLAYADDEDLDNLVVNFETERLMIDPGDPDAIPPVPPTYESDENLRMRSQQSWEGLSVAGPEKAYEYHAMSADGRVADAKAYSPTPAYVVVSLLSNEGDGAASAELIDIVKDSLSAEDTRPVGDRLTVQSATIVDYQVEATLYVYPGPEQEPILEAAQAALQSYIAERRRIGRDIHRPKIYGALDVEGVEDIDLVQPAADVVISRTESARCTSVNLTIVAYDE